MEQRFDSFERRFILLILYQVIKKAFTKLEQTISNLSNNSSDAVVGHEIISLDQQIDQIEQTEVLI